MSRASFRVSTSSVLVLAVLPWIRCPAQQPPAAEPRLAEPPFTRPAAGQAGDPGTLSLPTARERDRVWIDRPGDGSLWARGRDWKAEFTQRGATFLPFFGSATPRHFPVAIAFDCIRVDGRTIAAGADSPPEVRAGDAIAIERGPATEIYVLRPGEMEQTFVFPERLGRGELGVRMRIATELAALPIDGGGFRFVGDHGEVRYGAAHAFDARGDRTPVASTLRDGVLELTVPAAFHDAAAFPLTIDPVVLVFSGSTGAVARSFNADAAHLGSHAGMHAIAYEEAYTATDHDIFLRFFDTNGVPTDGRYVDYTTENWVTPQVASHRAASQFLTVAARGPANGTTTIWGRTFDYGVFLGNPTFNPGPQFAIHTFGNGMNPDVGGDPNPGAPLPGNYCVTWEGQINGEIYFNIVRTDSTTQGTNWLDPGQPFVSRPRISKSCGIGPAATREWIIVWQQRYHPIDEDIYGTLIGHSGTVNTLSFLIDFSIYSDTNPTVSSKTDLIDGYERFVVTYERALPSTPLQPAHTVLMAQVFTGTTSLSGPLNLSSLLQMSSLANQVQPCIDTDGCRFAVGFSNWSLFTTQDVAPYLATVHVTPGGGLGVTELPQLLNSYAGPDERMHVTSQRSGGSSNDGYVAAWDTTLVANGDMNVTACLYQGHRSIPPGGWFQNTVTGCGSLTLAAGGLPSLCNTFTLTLSGAQGAPFLMLGAPVAAVPACPSCRLGLNQTGASMLFTTSYAVTVPANPQLIGWTLAAQGIDIFGTGGCTAPVPYTLSNAIVVTII